MNADKQLWSAKQLAQRWGVSKEAVLVLFHKNAITAEISEGRLIRFDLDTVEKQLKSRTHKAEGPIHRRPVTVYTGIAAQIAYHAAEIDRLSGMLLE